jgi:hypothetical protein
MRIDSQFFCEHATLANCEPDCPPQRCNNEPCSGGRHKLSAADWASLIEPKQSIEKAPSSARQRFAPQNFLRTCAISSKHIPTALVTQIEQMCNMKAEQEGRNGCL